MDIQVKVLPTPSLSEEGNIYQYIGVTNDNYVNGMFYTCRKQNSSWTWNLINVQDWITEKANNIINKYGRLYLKHFESTSESSWAPLFQEVERLWASGHRNIFLIWDKVDTSYELCRIITYNIASDTMALAEHNHIIYSVTRSHKLVKEPQSLRISVMPEASEKELGNVYEFTGESTLFETEYRYICKIKNGVYYWEKLDTYAPTPSPTGRYLSIDPNQGLTALEKQNTKQNIDLEKVGNFKAVSTEANQSLTTAEIDNAWHNIKLDELSSDKVVKMTGYDKPEETDAITEEDTLNEAIGKLEKALDEVAPLSHNHSSNDVTSMGSYVMGTGFAPVTGSDTLNEAIGKLENQIARKVSITGVLTTGSSIGKITIDGNETDILVNGVSGVSESSGDSNNGKIHIDYLNGTSSDVPVHGLNNAAYCDVDDEVTEDSDNLITSGAVYDALDGAELTDENVTQTPTVDATDTGDFEVLLAGDTSSTEYTGHTKKSNWLKFSPSTKKLFINSKEVSTEGHTHVSPDVTIDDYDKTGHTGEIEDNDTLNEALAKLENALDDKAALSHTHVQSNIMMSGYIRGTDSSAVTGSDTLGQAIGKLENQIISGQGSVVSITGTLTSGSKIGTITIDGTSTDLNVQGVSNISEGATNGTISVSMHGSDQATEVPVHGLGSAAYKNESYFAQAEHDHISPDVTIDDYTTTGISGNIEDDDTLNEALAKLENNVNSKASSTHVHSGSDITTGVISQSVLPSATTSVSGIVQLSSSTGSTSEDMAATPKAVKIAYELAANHTQSSDTVDIDDDYEKPGTYSEIDPGDTLTEAIGKLEAAIDEVAPLSHNHSSNDVTSMGSYSKLSDSSPVTGSDTLNQAISKLENQIDDKSSVSITGTLTSGASIGTITIDGTSTILKVNGVSSISESELNGKIGVTNMDGTSSNVPIHGLGSAAYTDSDEYATAEHEHVSPDVTIDDYTKTGHTGEIEDNDTLNEALAKLENAIETKSPSTHTHSGSDIVSGMVSGSFLPQGSTTATGIVKLTSATGSSSENMAATPKAVKIAYELADYKSHVEVSNTSNTGDTIATITIDDTISNIKVNGIKDVDESDVNGSIKILKHGDTEYSNVQVHGLGTAAYTNANSYAAAEHEHSGGDIDDMSGYTKASSVSAISEDDTLYEAIGKLEKALDSVAPSSHTHIQSEVTMSGYIRGSSTSSVSPSDTLGQAIGKLENRIDDKSTVSITGTLTSGSNIGTITIDGTSTTLKVPESVDEKVKQTPTSASDTSDIEVILAGNDDNSTYIGGVKKSNYLKFNPSTKKLSVNGNEVSVNGHTHISPNVTIDDYDSTGVSGNITDGDELNTALAKLENNVNSKASSTHVHSGADITSGKVGASYLPAATTDAQGIVQLSDAIDSTSTTSAATANSVKTAYDLANSKSTVSITRNITSGTKIGTITIDDSSTDLYCNTNTDENVTQTASTGNANYELLFSYTADNTNRTEGVRKSNRLIFNPSSSRLDILNSQEKLAFSFTSTPGTTTSNGLASFALGNALGSGTAGNSYGMLRIYGTGTDYINLLPPTTLSEYHSIYLPDKGGTIATTDDIPELSTSTSSTSTTTAATSSAVKSAYDLASGKSTVSITGTLTSGTSIGTITIDDTSTILKVPESSDENVKQTNTTTNSSYNVLFSYSTNTTTAKTEGARKSSNLTFNPSTGVLTATKFSGDGSSLTSLNASNLSSGTVPNARLTSASTSAAGIVKLSDDINSTSTELAATANSVKTAYDLANGKSTVSFTQELTSGTKIGTITIDDSSTDLYCQTDNDTKVAQTNTTSNSEYNVLFSYSTNSTTNLTEEARKSVRLTFNPGTSTLLIRNNKGYDSNVIASGSGTTTTEGQSYIAIGNNIATGTAGNSYGFLRLFGHSADYVDLLPPSTLATIRTLHLPNKDGTLAITNDIPTITQVLTSGTKIATVTLGSTTTDLYAPSGGGEGTDEKVKQNIVSSSSSTAYPLILAYSASQTAETNTVNKSSSLTFTPLTNSLSLLNGSVETGNSSIRTVCDGYGMLTTIQSKELIEIAVNEDSTYNSAGITLGNSSTSGTTGNGFGFLRMYGTGSNYVELQTQSASGNYIVFLPNDTGTIALTKQISDTKVKQQIITDQNDHNLLFSESANSTLTNTEGAGKSSSLTFNPSSNSLKVNGTEVSLNGHTHTGSQVTIGSYTKNRTVIEPIAPSTDTVNTGFKKLEQRFENTITRIYVGKNAAMGWFKIGECPVAANSSLTCTLLISPTYEGALTTDYMNRVYDPTYIVSIGLRAQTINNVLVASIRNDLILRPYDTSGTSQGGQTFSPNDIYAYYDSTNSKIIIYIRTTQGSRAHAITVLNNCSHYLANKYEWVFESTQETLANDPPTGGVYATDVTASRYDDNGNVISSTYVTNSSVELAAIPGSITSKGTTATTTAGEVYGVAAITTSPYNYAKWFVNLSNESRTLTDGMIIRVKIPVTTVSYGACISLLNAASSTTSSFHPVVLSQSSLFTTHFALNNELMLMYDASGTCNVYENSASANVSKTGVWRLLTSYNSNDNNKVTQTATTTNANYEVLFSSTADNTTRTEGARKASSLTFNPSTGTLVTKNININTGKSYSPTITIDTHTANRTLYVPNTSGKATSGKVVLRMNCDSCDTSTATGQTDIDYNNYILTGFYEIWTGSGHKETLNAPDGVNTDNNFYLIVQARALTYVSQIAISVRDSKIIYTRNLLNGVWQSWVRVGNDNITYCTCATAAATAAKVINVPADSSWVLRVGAMITVKFSNTNTASNPTFNVNGTGTKSVYLNTAVITTSNLGYAGSTGTLLTYMYDGTYWVFVAKSTDSNSDTKVTQTATTTNANYEVLFSSTADNTTRTEGARKASNLKFNPSTGVLTTTNVNAPVYINQRDGENRVHNISTWRIENRTPSSGKSIDNPAIVRYNNNSGDDYSYIAIWPNPVEYPTDDPNNEVYRGWGGRFGLVIKATELDFNGVKLYDSTTEKIPNARLTSATTSTAGIVQLSDAIDSTSTTIAATASAVKTAYDLANGKSTVSITRSLTSGTQIGTITINSTSTNLYCQDKNVTQTATTTNANYEVLFSYTADNTTRTEGARKASNLKFNPSTGLLSATKFSGDGSAINNLNGSYIASGTVPIARLPEGTASAKGIVQLSDAIDSTSTTIAATASAVKTAYDLANGKSTVSITRSLTSGTKVGSITINGTSTDLYCQTNTDTKVTQTNTTVTTNTFYNVLLSSSEASTSNLTESARKSRSMQFSPGAGTTSTIGKACLTLGNSVASGTNANSQGYLRLYSSTANYVELSAASGITSDYDITFPAFNGQVLLRDLKDTFSGGTISSAGWYRVAVVTNTSSLSAIRGSNDLSCDIIIKRVYSNTNNEHHEVKLLYLFQSAKFVNEVSFSRTKIITQIRVGYSEELAYIDIYYSGTSANTVNVILNNTYVGTGATTARWTCQVPAKITDANETFYAATSGSTTVYTKKPGSSIAVGDPVYSRYASGQFYRYIGGGSTFLNVTSKTSTTIVVSGTTFTYSGASESGIARIDAATFTFTE